MAKRVALVASSFLPRLGGVEEHVANTARILAHRGYEVAVWAVDRNDPPLDDFEGVPVRYLSCPLPSRSLAGILRFLVKMPVAATRWLTAYLRDRPGVIHIQCFGPNGVYAYWLAWLMRVPLLYSHHGETAGDADDAFGRSALLRSALRRTIARAAVVTSCSASAAADLIRFGTSIDRVRIVANGVDLDEPVGQLPPALSNVRFVLGVGRLVPNKGFDTLIRAFAHVAREEGSSATTLVVGGDGPDLDRLRQLARDVGVGDRVVFLGRVSRPVLGALMRAATIVVIASRVEAFGIAVLEGWRAGVPVIAPNRGGPAEFARDGETALLADPDSVGDYALALRRVLNDRELADRLGAAGHQAVVGFTWESTVDSYELIYSAAAAGRELQNAGDS